MPQRLLIESLESIGAVDKGDNPGSPIVFHKRAGTVAPAGEPATLPATNRGTVRTHQGETMDRPDLSGIEDDQLRADLDAAFDAAEQRASELEDANADLEKRLEALEDEGEGEPDPLAKADPAVKAEVEAIRKQAEEDRQRLADEVAKRRDAEFAAKPYMKILGGADQVEAVRKLADADPEAFAKIETQLTALEQRSELAKVFEEFGTSEGGDADPVSKRDAWVAEHRKANPDVSIEKARAEFWKQNPDEREAVR